MDSVYSTKRGETVMPYFVFKELKFEAVMKSANQPYPKPNRSIKETSTSEMTRVIVETDDGKVIDALDFPNEHLNRLPK